MGDGSKLVKTFQQIAKVPEQEQAGFVIGTVISTTPLKIKVGDKLELTESFLILGALVKETIIDVFQPGIPNPGHSHISPASGLAYATGLGGDPVHAHAVNPIESNIGLTRMILWKGLELNDIVYMIRLNSGQKYFVLQKEGGVGI